MQKKVLVLSYHLWNSNKRGGLHYLSEGFSKRGYDITFVTFPLHLFKFIRENKNWFLKILKLLKGITHCEDGSKIMAYASPIVILPPKYENFGFFFFNHFFFILSFYINLLHFRKLKFEYILIESTQAVALTHILKKRYREAKIIYRQSDLIQWVTSSKKISSYEKSTINLSDLTLFPSQLRKNFVIHNYGLNKQDPKFHILENGFDLQKFHACIDRSSAPEKTALYVGAHSIDWDYIFTAAANLPDIKFQIIYPGSITSRIRIKIKDFKNIEYINGVPAYRVPYYIYKSSICIVPYESSDPLFFHYLGMHSKIFQFMYAQKPIVIKKLVMDKKYDGIFISNSKIEFIENIKQAIDLENINHNIDFEFYTWENRIKQFFKILNNLNDS